MTEHIQQIHAYLGSEASDEECRRLEAWMKEDESHVDQFVREALLHYQLREALREEFSTPAPLDDEKDRLSCGDGAGGASTAAAPCLPSNEDLPPGMDPLPGSSVFRICGNAFSAWPAPIFGVLLFVVLGMGGLYFGLGGSLLSDGGQNRLKASMNPTASMPTCKANDVATLEELSECIWEEPQGDSIISGERVSLGRLLNLRKGKARVKFDCGAVVTIGGPALMKIDSDMDATLHHGNLSIIVPDEARGFLVHTSEMDIRDLGTEFTLSLDKHGQTQLEVVDGEVEASFSPKNNIETKKHSLKTGEYLHANRPAFGGDGASQYLNAFRGIRVDFTNMRGFHLLEIINEDKNYYRHDPVNQCLSIDTSWGSVWGNACSSKGTGDNLFLLPVPKLNDFDVILSVARFVPKRLSEHVGLLVLDDTDNFTRMIYAMGTDHEGTYLKFNVESDGNPGKEVRESASFGSGSFQLRMSRRGSEISGWWSRNGRHWNLCGRSTKQQSILHAGFYVSKGHPYPKCSTPYQQALIEEVKIEIKD